MTNIGPRKDHESYGMRGTQTRPSDRVTRWTRRIGSHNYEFSRVAWEGGRMGYTLRAFVANTTVCTHMWEFNAKGEYLPL
jgi:hypothetical protein